MGRQGWRSKNRNGIAQIFTFASPRSPVFYNSNRNGFTLLEIAIAMGIFGVTLVSSIAAVSQMHLLQETGRNLSVASFHAQKVIEQVRLLADMSIESASAVNWTSWASANGCNTMANEAISVSFASITSNLTEVTVNLAWNTKDHPMTYQVVTRVVN